jgi:tripartite-type tricarboxylate transporter receptor subunit TctC
LVYDPTTSFEPICLLVKVPLVIVVNSSSPYNSLSDLFAGEEGAPARCQSGRSALHRLITLLK